MLPLGSGNEREDYSYYLRYFNVEMHIESLNMFGKARIGFLIWTDSKSCEGPEPVIDFLTFWGVNKGDIWKKDTCGLET
jgi:hypothetical protein